MKRAVLGLKKRLPETTFLCLSNSNEVYIKTILEVSLLTLRVMSQLIYRNTAYPTSLTKSSPTPPIGILNLQIGYTSDVGTPNPNLLIHVPWAVSPTCAKAMSSMHT
jgi:hypothetical protein